MSRIGQGRHLAVQCQDFQAGARILLSDEAVKEARSTGSFKRNVNRVPIQWLYQSTAQHVNQAGTSIGFSHPIVMLNGDICFTDNLIRSKDFGACTLDQSTQLVDTIREIHFGFTAKQPYQYRRINPVTSDHVVVRERLRDRTCRARAEV